MGGSRTKGGAGEVTINRKLQNEKVISFLVLSSLLKTVREKVSTWPRNVSHTLFHLLIS